MKRVIFVILLILIFCCQNQDFPTSNDEKVLIGEFRVVIDMALAPKEIVIITGSLSSDNYEIIEFEFEIVGDTAFAQLDSVPSGVWVLCVNALNSDQVVLYTGSVEIFVNPNTTTPIHLHLDPTTGDLNITITWGKMSVDKILAYYPLNGNALDESGNANHGKIFGAKSTIDRFGNSNSAYTFDGIDDFIYISDAPILNPKKALSISVWINLHQYKSYPSANNIIVKDNYNSKQRNYLMQVGGFQGTHDQVEFDVFSGGNILKLAGGKIELDTWYHIVGTYDGKKMKLFINNELISEKEYTGEINDYDIPLLIAHTNNTEFSYNDRFFNGTLDEIYLYNYAINTEEIAELYAGH